MEVNNSYGVGEVMRKKGRREILDRVVGGKEGENGFRVIEYEVYRVYY